MNLKTKPFGVAIVGCGNIAGEYFKNLRTYPNIEVIGVADKDPERAAKFATTFGCRAFSSVEELLRQESVQLVINLTIHHAHKEVITQCLNAGKHVHSEKPLALTHSDAQGLVKLAKKKKLRLGCSPATFMGEAQQTAWKWIREGKLGKVRVAYAEVNWGRIEAWHPSPEPFYQVGALFDVGVYPLTLLTSIFGPARSVRAAGKVLFPKRKTNTGRSFRITTPDFVVAIIELSSGTTVRLTTNFYVSQSGKQGGIEFHGDLGSLYLSHAQVFNAGVEVAPFGKPYASLPLIKEPFNGTEWGRPIVDLVDAIGQDRAHRATGEQACHVVEILCATAKSIEQNRPISIRSKFKAPAPMAWAL